MQNSKDMKCDEISLKKDNFDDVCRVWPGIGME